VDSGFFLLMMDVIKSLDKWLESRINRLTSRFERTKLRFARSTGCAPINEKKSAELQFYKLRRPVCGKDLNAQQMGSHAIENAT